MFDQGSHRASSMMSKSELKTNSWPKCRPNSLCSFSQAASDKQID